MNSSGTPSTQSEMPRATSPLEVFRATPMQRVELLKTGLSARDAMSIVADLAIPPSRACKAINISRASLTRKARQNVALALPEAERVLGVAKLIGQVQQMVEESGNPTGFDASAWVSSWLVEPLPALGGGLPIDLLDTMEGQGLVAKLLRQIQGGVYV